MGGYSTKACDCSLLLMPAGRRQLTAPRGTHRRTQTRSCGRGCGEIVGRKRIMSDLKGTIDVECPTFYALHHAERFFTLRRRDHTPGMLTLRVDLSSLKLPGSSQARHDVRVRHELREIQGKKQLALAWDPEDQTVPRFAGTLTAGEKAPGETTLTLEGGYEPPLGVAGKAFDLVVGRKIALATARALLDDLKQFIELDYKAAKDLASSPKE
jgi:hypothetical protein